MNTYVTLACLLAVCGAAHSSAIGLGLGELGGLGGYGLGGYGLGGYGLGGLGLGYGLGAKVVLAPAAVSTQNLVKAAPIPVIRTIAAPVIASPVIKTVVPGVWGGYGLGGIGSYGISSAGLGAWGNGLGWGKGVWGEGLGWGKL